MNTNQVAERTNDSSCGVRDPCRLGDNWHRTFNTIYRQATVWVSVTPAARASDVLRALRTSAWREDACLFSRRRQDHYIRPDIIISSIRKLRKRVLKFSLPDNTDARDETLEYAEDSLIVRVPRSPLYLEVKIHFASAAEAPRSNLAAWKYDLTKGPSGTILEKRIPVHHPPMRELSHKLGLAGPRSSEQRMINPTLFDECSAVVRQSVSEWLGPSRVSRILWGFDHSVDTTVIPIEDPTPEQQFLLNFVRKGLDRRHRRDPHEIPLKRLLLYTTDSVEPDTRNLARRALFSIFRHKAAYMSDKRRMRARPGAAMLAPSTLADTTTYEWYIRATQGTYGMRQRRRWCHLSHRALHLHTALRSDKNSARRRIESCRKNADGNRRLTPLQTTVARTLGDAVRLRSSADRDNTLCDEINTVCDNPRSQHVSSSDALR